MKKNEIKVGGLYLAKVSGKITTVRVDAIRKGGFTSGGSQTAYDVTNLKTGRKTTFRSAAKFRCEAKLLEAMKAECSNANELVQSREMDAISDTWESTAPNLIDKINKILEEVKSADPTSLASESDPLLEPS